MKQRFLATAELPEEMVKEMHERNFTNPSQYLRWRISQLLNNKGDLPENNETDQMTNKGQQLPVPFKLESNVEDKVQIAELKKDLERYKELVAEFSTKQKEGLGNLPTTVEAEVERRLREKEFTDLKLEKKDLENKKADLEKDIKEKEAEINKLKGQLNVWDQVQKVAPAITPIMSGIAAGIANGGGLKGFFAGLAGAGSQQPSSNVNLSTEDEQDLSLIRDIKEMFTPEELQTVLQTVVTMGQRKELIGKMPMLINHLINGMSRKAEPETVSPIEENKQSTNNQEQSEQLKYSDQPDDDGVPLGSTSSSEFEFE